MLALKRAVKRCRDDGTQTKESFERFINSVDILIEALVDVQGTLVLNENYTDGQADDFRRTRKQDERCQRPTPRFGRGFAEDQYPSEKCRSRNRLCGCQIC